MFKQRGFTEKKIGDMLDEIARNYVIPTDSVHNFKTRKIDKLWLIEFKYRAVDNYTLKLKDKVDTRYFTTLNAVGNWMKKMEIPEFKVILE